MGPYDCLFNLALHKGFVPMATICLITFKGNRVSLEDKISFHFKLVYALATVDTLDVNKYYLHA